MKKLLPLLLIVPMLLVIVPSQAISNYVDILPTAISTGQWNTIKSGHHLVPMKDGRVLDWVANTGEWKLWNYNPQNTNDILPGKPIAKGQWDTIKSGHQLIPMKDGRVLDWVANTGEWKLWNYNPQNTNDILPGKPVSKGKWDTIKSGHQLIPMKDGRILDWVVNTGEWRLWNYDAR
ncbi:MAG: hypothetical protein D3921_08365 [Candidatus Electrothrix sp. AW1]|nr:hypothetical protein [Candidatus Electrothrix sp. AX1]MCI5182516.1 hypothetical protein [Candidatus Electrothrix gigas]MCI5226153.1 hypothetical protein [Candidatus Electrothrix gigas]